MTAALRRCASCGLAQPPPIANDGLPILDALRPHLVSLLQWAREFDALDPGPYSAVEFVDWLALNLQAGGPGKIAGRAGPEKRAVMKRIEDRALAVA